MANFINYTDEQINDLLVKIHAGVIAPENLPVDLYDAIGAKLMDGVFSGFGGGFSDFNIESPFFDLLAEYEVNIQVFSAAKTFQQVNSMSKFVFIDGQKTDFTTFKDIAGTIFETYNEAWLKTEHRTAVNNAFAGNQWLTVNQDAADLPLLRYQTVGDERVRPEHADLDNIVKPVNDSFWDRFFPPNGWNCRCIVEQLESGEAEVTPTTTKGKGKNKKYFDSKGNIIDRPPSIFDFNAGETKQIFKGTGSEMHPYFRVAERFKQKKRRNFDLPLRPKRVTLPKP